MNKTVTQIVVQQAAFWALLAAAFAAQVEGALNVLKFVVWVSVPLSLLLLADSAQIDGARAPRRPLLGALRSLLHWTTLLLLAWFGHFATAAAWAVVMLAGGIYRLGVEKHRAQATEPRP